MGRFQDAKKERICIDCGIKYIATSPRQIRCGSARKKEGCSWKMYKKRKAQSTKVWGVAQRSRRKEMRERKLLALLKEKYEN